MALEDIFKPSTWSDETKTAVRNLALAAATLILTVVVKKPPPTNNVITTTAKKIPFSRKKIR